ncbi:MAG: hypothetical protein JXA92_12645 [candidate division Zixibacteria bacterium]|nr:hypothetical protein [candidate division Zixibacteria bacterium]
MTLKCIFIFISVVIILSANTYAQGDYIENCRGGAQAVGGLQINGDADGFSGGISGSYKGIIDFGLAIGYMDIHENGTRATTFSPSIFIHAVKPSYFNTPVSVSLGFVYHDQTTKPDEDAGNEYYTPKKVKADYYIPQIIVYRNYEVNPSTVIQPNLGLGYAFGNRFLEEGYFEGLGEDNQVIFSCGASMFFENNENSIFRADLGVQVDERYTTVGIQLGLIYKLPKR